MRPTPLLPWSAHFPLPPFPPIEEPEPETTAEVCQEIPKVSEWARAKFEFPATDIQASVLDADTRRLILNCCRQWGKTTTIALKALHFAVYHPGKKVFIISRTKSQAALLVDKVIGFASLLGAPAKAARGYNRSLELANGSAIIALAGTADTSRGRTADILIVDEASIVRDTVFATVAPFIARTGGAIWLLSTPSGQSGFFYHFWFSGDNSWLKIKSTVDDCPDISREFLAMQEKLCPTTYRQEFFCDFLPPPGALFSREMIEAMLDPKVEQWHIPV